MPVSSPFRINSCSWNMRMRGLTRGKALIEFSSRNGGTIYCISRSPPRAWSWPKLVPSGWTSAGHRMWGESSWQNKERHYACKYRPSQKIGSVLDRELLNISGQMGDDRGKRFALIFLILVNTTNREGHSWESVGIGIRIWLERIFQC